MTTRSFSEVSAATRSSEGLQLRRRGLGAGPAVLGDVDHHAVRALVLLLEEARRGHRVAVLAMLGAGRTELLASLLDVLDPEAEVVQAVDRAHAVVAVGRFVCLEIE